MPSQKDGVARPGDREDPHGVVDPRVLPERGEDARAGWPAATATIVAISASWSDSAKRSLISSHDRRARPHRACRSRAAPSPHPGDELLPDRLVEAERARSLSSFSFWSERALAREAQLDDVAGHDAHQEEDQHRHPQQRGDHQQERASARYLPASPSTRPALERACTPRRRAAVGRRRLAAHSVEPHGVELVVQVVAGRDRPALHLARCAG